METHSNFFPNTTVGKTRASDILQFCPHIRKKKTIAQLTLRRRVSLSNQIYKIPKLENYGISVKP